MVTGAVAYSFQCSRVEFSTLAKSALWSMSLVVSLACIACRDKVLLPPSDILSFCTPSSARLLLLHRISTVSETVRSPSEDFYCKMYARWYWSILFLCVLDSTHAIPATPNNQQDTRGSSLSPRYENNSWSPNIWLTVNSVLRSSFPPDFKCELHVDDVMLNPLAMWMNAIQAVYELSAVDMRRRWEVLEFSLPAYDVAVILNANPDTEGGPPNLQTRFIIWTIQYLMLNVWTLRIWQAVTAIPSWQGRDVGIVRMGKKGLPSMTQGNHGNNTHHLLSISEDGVNGTDISLTVDRGIRYLFHYEGSPVQSSYVFLAALVGIGSAGEKGLDSRCERFYVRDNSVVTFDFTSSHDQHGNPLMRYGHMRVAMKRMVWQMVKDRKFHEMNMVLVRDDGQEIAQGGLKLWRSPPALGAATEQ